ncbi:MAG: hypothetical protein K2I93_04735 [Oscillospiraceae bacterium]|nr:hypothetical protein [Oscillospiraceae bacterium]
MKPTDPLYELYWLYVVNQKDCEEFLNADDIFSKFLDPDTVTGILCKMKERVETDAFRAGFMTAAKIFMGGNGE